ncbi:uncharacterized protein LOC116417993 [Nasonia vitripennis]|uniref:Uncharacterized protein n=1 Tax=Nasonia vitripennis TaxID=7425 RepID=A0A7M7QM44_NASVI|nr:uncharacterized protein LOC116417993 [Nasonia vitripennis]
MSKFSVICGAKEPNRLRGTLFRKQVATKCMEKGINEQEVEKLAGYMGHTPRIHIQNYRQSVLQRDFAVAEMMQKAQSSKTTPPRFQLEEEDSETSLKEPEQLGSVTENQDENEKENDGNTQNNNYNVGRRPRLNWNKAQAEAVLEAFPDAPNSNVKAPSADKINEFLRTSTNAEIRRRTKLQIRQWIHNEKKKNPGKSDSVPSRNVVPTYIYIQDLKNIYLQKRYHPMKHVENF